jgi:hypothetical protein
MSLTTTYEVYVEKGDGWSIQSVFDNRFQAMDEARALIDRDRVPSVQVIEERFDAGSGKTQAAIVFRGSRPTGGEIRAEAVFKRPPVTASAKRKTMALPKPPQGLFARTVFMLLVLAAGAIGMLIAMAVIGNMLL